jgi:hypothetical protein
MLPASDQLMKGGCESLGQMVQLQSVTLATGQGLNAEIDVRGLSAGV